MEYLRSQQTSNSRSKAAHINSTILGGMLTFQTAWIHVNENTIINATIVGRVHRAQANYLQNLTTSNDRNNKNYVFSSRPNYSSLIYPTEDLKTQ